MSDNNKKTTKKISSKKRKDKKTFIDYIKEREKAQRFKDTTELRVLSKSTLNKRLLLVMIFFVLLFMGLALYLVYFQLFKAKVIADNTNNKRLWINEDKIERGDIYDKNGNVLAYSDTDSNGNQIRVYNYGKVSSTVTGYNSKTYGKTGIERTYNKYLLSLNDENLSNFRKMVITNNIGSDVYLTLDQNIQNIAYDYMKDYVGSVVVMNPKTGDVLAMISNPTYDPNIVESDWENLIANTDGPLVNRATKGLYRPGSTFKIVTANAILENNIDESYNDTGSEVIQNFEIKNFEDNVFGAIDLRSAFVNSVNTYFAAKTIKMGKDDLQKMTDKYMFNKTYPFDLEKYDSIIPYDELNQADLAMTGFGYGKSQVTPLHMAMVTSAIANGGRMMQPRLVSKVIDKDGKSVYESSQEILSTVTSAKNAEIIRDLMVAVVNEGTATGAYIDGIQVAGKTGTADKENGLVDAWFVGFAPAYDPKIAVSIVIENSEDTAGVRAAPIARDLITDIFNNINLD